jgi:hypothetical protein
MLWTTYNPLPTVRRTGRLAACLAALLALATAGPAKADFIISVLSVSASAGSTGNALEVSLTNTGSSAATVAGFSFGVSVAGGSGISFTDVTTATAPDAYIFTGHSLFGPDIVVNNSGTDITAADVFDTPFGGATLGAGDTLGLGEVFFDVDPATTGVIPVTLDAFPVTSLADENGANLSFTPAGGSITVTTTSIAPEPGTCFLFSQALVGVALWVWVRRNRNVPWATC